MDKNLPNEKSLTKTSQQKYESVTLTRFDNNLTVITSRSASQLTFSNKNWYQIKWLIKDKGEAYVVTCIMYLLKEALTFVGHNLTSNEIGNYADMFSQEFEHWSLDDFTMCLRNGITGKYGKSNKNFSYETLGDWANRFENDRLDYFEKENTKHKESSDIHHRISPTINEQMAIIIPPHLKTVKEIDEHFNKVKK